MTWGTTGNSSKLLISHRIYVAFTLLSLVLVLRPIHNLIGQYPYSYLHMISELAKRIIFTFQINKENTWPHTL